MLENWKTKIQPTHHKPLQKVYLCAMAEKMTAAECQLASELIQQAKHIVITSHKSPDGDAVGSLLSLYQALKKQGKSCTPILPDAVPDFLQWLPGYEDIVLFDRDSEQANTAIKEADLLFSLDYNNLSRVGKDMEIALRAASGNFILIDHHQQPEAFAKVTYSDTASCSTAQLIYRFIDQLGWKQQIDPTIGAGIYCGIMTDSGSFRFPSVTPETHYIVADLKERGLDHAHIHRMVYDTNLLDRLRLVGFALSQKLEVIESAHTAIISLTKEELDQFNHRPGDTEGLVNQALSLKGIEVAAFFREGNNEVKVSFRSKHDFDVNVFARNGWNGGGHRNAAGGSTMESVEQAVARFKQEIHAAPPQLKNDE